MTFLTLRTVIAASILTVMAIACSSEDTNNSGGTTSGGASGGSSGSGSSGSAAAPKATCLEQCSTKVKSCQAPTDPCPDICDGTITQTQLTCLSGKSCQELAAVDQASSLSKICPPSTGTSSSSGGSSSSSGSGGGDVGKVGDACKCSDGNGPFSCGGTGSGCESGLVCQGQSGISGGECAGPRCCSTADECEKNFDTQANCPSGLKCRSSDISPTKTGYCTK